MVCLGFKPAAAGWKAQTKPRSYDGRPVDFVSKKKIVAVIKSTSNGRNCIGASVSDYPDVLKTRL